MGDAEAVRKVAIRSAIVRYLRTRPKARDTASGICCWWLPAEGMSEMGYLIDEVLEQMVADGLLRCYALADGTVLYGAA